MPPPEPDEATIEAWLSGELPPETADRVERYFQDHPEKIASATGEGDPTLFRGLTGELDPEDTQMIAKVKSGLALGTDPIREDCWKEILAPADRDGILGTLGEYDVTEVIATGGMATVLKGYDPALDRHAALKVLSPEMAANAAARERFLREARAAARLEHEHVLPVYEVHDETIPWFAMRYVEGETLQERIDRGVVFSTAELKSIARQMAAALEAAQAEGIVHRDIKPANVLFDGDSDRLWVCDFGIARCSEDPSLTYPGAIAGTPHFMSPEQARGEEVDGRSDLFSLGAVLYFAASGRHPFAGETTAAVLRKVEEGCPPSLKRTGARYPRWLRGLISALLSKEPDLRPADASEVLTRITEERAGPVPDNSNRSSRVGRVALVVAAILLAAALYQWFTNREDFQENSGLSHQARVRLAASAGTGDAAREPGTVELEETGEIFSSLQEAIGATSGDATFLLRGRLECPDILYGGVDQRIDLLAAPGASPVVASTHLFEHALFLQGPSRIFGIRFERTEASNNGRPILGFLSNEGEVVIEDCVFYQNPITDGESNLTPALGITGTKLATVRRCLFQGGSGLWLAFAEHRGVADSTTRVEDCVFDNTRAFRLHSWVSRRNASVHLERCVGLLDDFAELKKESREMSASFELVDCLIDADHSLFFSEAPTPSLFFESLQWNGDNNVFRSDIAAIAPAIPPGGIEPELWENIQNTGLMSEAPTDRSLLGSCPVNLPKWREALSAEAPEAARETLGRFVP